MPALVFLDGDYAIRRVELKQDLVSLGRNPDCQVVINLPSVSREHARILEVQGDYYIEDGGSRNGTFVNGKKIVGRERLHDNDRISICDWRCSFETITPPLPQPSEEESQVVESTVVVADQLNRAPTRQLLEKTAGNQLAPLLVALIDISAELNRAVELDSLLPRVADGLFKLFEQAERCFVILCDDPSNPLVAQHFSTRDRADRKSLARFSNTIVKQCLSTKTGLLSEDASIDNRFDVSQSITHIDIRSVMCAPLCFGNGRAVGVIQLDTLNRFKKFHAEDLGLLMVVANLAAVALENFDLRKKAAQKERDLALTTTVHNLRQPLFILRGVLGRIRDHVKVAPVKIAPTREAIEDAAHSLKRCEDIVTSVLRFSKERQVGRDMIDLKKLLDSVLPAFRDAHPSMGLHADVPENITIIGDAEPLRQVFEQLLENAARELKDGGTIRIVAEDKAEVATRLTRVRVTVEDDGPGVPAQMMGKLFEPFNTTTPNGCGLGLAFVKRVLNSVQGKVWHEAVSPRGARFVLEFRKLDPSQTTSGVRVSSLGIPAQIGVGRKTVDPEVETQMSAGQTEPSPASKVEKP